MTGTGVRVSLSAYIEGIGAGWPGSLPVPAGAARVGRSRTRNPNGGGRKTEGGCLHPPSRSVDPPMSQATNAATTMLPIQTASRVDNVIRRKRNHS